MLLHTCDGYLCRYNTHFTRQTRNKNMIFFDFLHEKKTEKSFHCCLVFGWLPLFVCARPRERSTIYVRAPKGYHRVWVKIHGRSHRRMKGLFNVAVVASVLCGIGASMNVLICFAHMDHEFFTLTIVTHRYRTNVDAPMDSKIVVFFFCCCLDSRAPLSQWNLFSI